MSSSFSNSTPLPEEPAITWMEYIAEADLKEPEYQKSISHWHSPLPGSASIMPISKLYFSNADEVREVCSIGMEDILTNMEDYFMGMFDQGPESAKTDLLKADDLQSLGVKVPHTKLAHLGIQSNLLPHIPQSSEHLNATDELSFAQNVRQEVLNTVAELLMRIKSQQPGHNVQRQFYVKPYDAEKLSPITYAVLQSGHNPDSEERKNSATLAAFIVPPWRMGEQELQAFVAPQRLPRLDSIFPRQPGMKRGYNRAVSVDTTSMSSGLWALIHGRCKADNIDHFVLTTYEHWVFGAFAAFAADHYTAYVLPPIPRSSTDPTIMEMLMFWTLSSASDGEGWWPPTYDAYEGKRKASKSNSVDGVVGADFNSAAVSHKRPCTDFTPSPNGWTVVSPKYIPQQQEHGCNWLACGTPYSPSTSQAFSSTSASFTNRNVSSPVPFSSEHQQLALTQPGYYDINAPGNTYSRASTVISIDSATSGYTELYTEDGTPQFDLTHYHRYAESQSPLGISESGSQAYNAWHSLASPAPSYSGFLNAPSPATNNDACYVGGIVEELLSTTNHAQLYSGEPLTDATSYYVPSALSPITQTPSTLTHASLLLSPSSEEQLVKEYYPTMVERSAVLLRREEAARTQSPEDFHISNQEDMSPLYMWNS